MLNGLKALFTSGIIFRPMVLSGVIIGFLLSSFSRLGRSLSVVRRFELLFDGDCGVRSLYFVFNQIYKGRGRELDYGAMGGALVGNLFQLGFSGILSFVFLETLIFKKAVPS